jgi:hypothetical protein
MSDNRQPEPIGPSQTLALGHVTGLRSFAHEAGAWLAETIENTLAELHDARTAALGPDTPLGQDDVAPAVIRMVQLADDVKTLRDALAPVEKQARQLAGREVEYITDPDDPLTAKDPAHRRATFYDGDAKIVVAPLGENTLTVNLPQLRAVLVMRAIERAGAAAADEGMNPDQVAKIKADVGTVLTGNLTGIIDDLFSLMSPPSFKITALRALAEAYRKTGKLALAAMVSRSFSQVWTPGNGYRAAIDTKPTRGR